MAVNEDIADRRGKGAQGQLTTRRSHLIPANSRLILSHADYPFHLKANKTELDYKGLLSTMA